MALDIEGRLRSELRDIVAEHSSRMAAVDADDPLAPAAEARNVTMTRSLLRNLLSSVPIGSEVADEVKDADRRLCP